MTAGDAVVFLSNLAADFKTGIVADEVVKELIDSILSSMNLEDDERARVRRLALAQWFIEA